MGEPDDQETDDGPATRRERGLSKGRRNKMNFALANVRSLIPKMDSLIDYFNEYDPTFCMITETWIKNNKELLEM